MNTLIKRTAPTKEVIDKEFSIADTYLPCSSKI
jgi:hypothetical protein